MSARPAGHWLMIGAIAIVVATVAIAIWTMGSPAQQRLLRMDERRINDLGQLEDAVNNWHATHKQLPQSLTVLKAQPGVMLDITDPVSARGYEYAVVDADSFRLCAVFASDTAEVGQRSHAWLDRRWPHGKGRHCFERRLDAQAKATP